MTFVHFGLLSLAGLAAIPILLHLLTLHRLKTVELSTFRFLFDSYIQQRRQIKFLEAILAILRTLFVLFMVLAVARPVAKKWSALFGGASQGEVIMIVDCSASMNARAAGKSSIDRARTTALAVAERMSADNRLTLVRLTSRAEIVFSRFSADTEGIRDKIAGLLASPSRANLYAALGELFGLAAYRQPGQTIYLFTDCQSSAWREVKDQGLAGILPPESKLVVVNVGSAAPLANRAVVGDAPQESRVVVGLPVMLRPKVVNHSKTESAEATIGVTLDEKEAGRVTVGLKPGESVAREVVFIPREPGTLRGRFEIAADSFPDDDAFLFTLNVVPAVKVVVVNGVVSKDPLESESIFVRTAMQTQPEPTGGSDAKRTSGGTADLAPSPDFVRSLDVREIAEPELNAAVLLDASVVVLANTGALNAQHFAWLRDFVANGGGLIIFPGDKVNPDVYSKQFLGSPAAQANQARQPPSRRPASKTGSVASPQDPLVDAILAPPLGDLERIDQFEKLANIDFPHPIFSVFDDPKAKYLTTARFFRRFKLQLGEDRANTWPLAYFTSGDPAIVESRLGQGAVLLAAFPANSKWSNLPLKPEFVPLVLRMVSYVMRRAEIEAPSVVPAGSSAEIVLANSWAPATAKVTDPARRSAGLNFNRAEGRLAAAFPNTSDKGYYAVEISGGATEQPRHGSVAFAVNLSPDESNFAMISEDNLHDWLPDTDVKLVDASAEAQQLEGKLGDEREIWRPLIVLMFLVIAVEFLLSTLGGARDETQQTVADRIRNLSPGRWVGAMTGSNETATQQ